jgi:hypothetical protein
MQGTLTMPVKPAKRLIFVLANCAFDAHNWRMRMLDPHCPCDNDQPDPCPKCGATVATGVCAAGLYTEAIVSAVINAIGDSEGEPIALRAATILAAIRKLL